MKQGSILAFLQPKINPKSPTVQEVQVQISETVDSGSSSESETVVETNTFGVRSQAVQNVQIIPLKDSRAAIVPVSAFHIERLKAITTTLFPVRYSDKFFNECLEPQIHRVVAFVALYDSKPVGWIRCRYEPFPNELNMVYQQLYIQIIGVLAPFRGLGLAQALLENALLQARKAEGDVQSVCAHVWEKNDDALLWYTRQGFAQIMVQPQYYRRLQPSGAWLVRRELT